MSAALAADVDRIKPTQIRLMNMFVYVSMVVLFVCVYELLVRRLDLAFFVFYRRFIGSSRSVLCGFVCKIAVLMRAHTLVSLCIGLGIFNTCQSGPECHPF